MKLPNADRVNVDLKKLQEYSLNADHRTGRHKARVFSSALGRTREDAEILRQTLLEVARKYDAVPQLKDDYGQRYRIDFPLE